MLAKTIIQTEQWKVTGDFLGMGAIRATNRSGETVTATAEEKQYLSAVLSALRESGVDISPPSPIAVAAVTDFAKAIHQRHRRAGPSGGFAYAKFFSTYLPYDTARQYIEKSRQQSGGEEPQ